MTKTYRALSISDILLLSPQPKVCKGASKASHVSDSLVSRATKRTSSKVVRVVYTIVRYYIVLVMLIHNHFEKYVFLVLKEFLPRSAAKVDV